MEDAVHARAWHEKASIRPRECSLLRDPYRTMPGSAITVRYVPGTRNGRRLRERGRNGLRVQRLGEEVPALGSRCAGVSSESRKSWACQRFVANPAVLEAGSIEGNGEGDLDHDRVVSPESQPRGRAARATVLESMLRLPVWASSVRSVARSGDRRRRHRRACRQPGALCCPRCRGGCGGRGCPRPELRIPCVKNLSRLRAARDATGKKLSDGHPARCRRLSFVGWHPPSRPATPTSMSPTRSFSLPTIWRRQATLARVAILGELFPGREIIGIPCSRPAGRPRGRCIASPSRSRPSKPQGAL